VLAGIQAQLQDVAPFDVRRPPRKIGKVPVDGQETVGESVGDPAGQKPTASAGNSAGTHRGLGFTLVSDQVREGPGLGEVPQGPGRARFAGGPVTVDLDQDVQRCRRDARRCP
jgi:hypothetical protein